MEYLWVQKKCWVLCVSSAVHTFSARLEVRQPVSCHNCHNLGSGSGQRSASRRWVHHMVTDFQTLPDCPKQPLCVYMASQQNSLTTSHKSLSHPLKSSYTLMVLLFVAHTVYHLLYRCISTQLDKKLRFFRNVVTICHSRKVCPSLCRWKNRCNHNYGAS